MDESNSSLNQIDSIFKNAKDAVFSMHICILMAFMDEYNEYLLYIQNIIGYFFSFNNNYIDYNSKDFNDLYENENFIRKKITDYVKSYMKRNTSKINKIFDKIKMSTEFIKLKFDNFKILNVEVLVPKMSYIILAAYDYYMFCIIGAKHTSKVNFNFGHNRMKDIIDKICSLMVEFYSHGMTIEKLINNKKSNDVFNIIMDKFYYAVIIIIIKIIINNNIIIINNNNEEEVIQFSEKNIILLYKENCYSKVQNIENQFG